MKLHQSNNKYLAILHLQRVFFYSLPLLCPDKAILELEMIKDLRWTGENQGRMRDMRLIPAHCLWG